MKPRLLDTPTLTRAVKSTITSSVAEMAKKGVTLVQTDFPLYTIRALGDRHFIVAGGGGQAKTGIGNAIVRTEPCNTSVLD